MSSVDLSTNSIRKTLARWAVTRRTSKNHKTVKIGGWALARDNIKHVFICLTLCNQALSYVLHCNTELCVTLCNTELQCVTLCNTKLQCDSLLTEPCGQCVCVCLCVGVWGRGKRACVHCE